MRDGNKAYEIERPLFTNGKKIDFATLKELYLSKIQPIKDCEEY